jgi:hypothetical protein
MNGTGLNTKEFFLNISDSIVEVFTCMRLNTLLPSGLEVLNGTLDFFWFFIASILASFHPVSFPVSMY